MRAEISYQCEACKDKFKVSFRKPNAITPTVFTTTCSVCESKFHIKASKEGTNFRIDTLEWYCSNAGDRAIQDRVSEKRKATYV